MKFYLFAGSLLLAGLLMAFRFSRSITVTGRVTDEKHAPLRYASLTVKGSRTSTLTDSSGAFSIEVPGPKSILVVSRLGYTTAEVQVNNQREMVVALQPEQAKLEEVVITAYGNQPKRSMARAMGASPGIRFSSPLMQKDESIQADGRQPDDGNASPGLDREGYDHIVENRFLRASDNPLSTFSIDVDAASYSNVRRMLRSGQLPPAGAVRIEEMINYFTYTYPQPAADAPFSINTEMARCPWNEAHRLVSIGLQGRKIDTDKLPACNLTFLIDVSGSMEDENKLPLVKTSLRLLTRQLRPQDRVSIVVYAGQAGLVLPPTPGTQKERITRALDKLEAGGSTAGGEGIELAYKTAAANFIPDGNNRVILCTDGDFNVGQSSDDALERLIGEKRKSGIFLTVLGFGMGNYQDAKMQKLADKGNGNHAYIDNPNEARKVLVNEFGGTLFTIAQDVKLQVEFNPRKVKGYRLIGYENRMLAKEDFNNDKKDAGDLGSGHTVTALYEIIPAGAESPELDSVDALRYGQPSPNRTDLASGSELMNIRLRYKQPGSETSRLLQHPVADQQGSMAAASGNLRFAAAVAQFGMLLRNSAYKANSSYAMIRELAAQSPGDDPEGYRSEFLRLAATAQQLSKDLAQRRK